MILSVSRRTDIPCYYAEWFANRVRAGFCLTRNPRNPAQLYRIPITPVVGNCIVFWTKDPERLLPFLPELDGRGFRYYFQFTVTPYGREIEPGLRQKEQIERTFLSLSEQIGRRRVVWRYDPILLCDGVDIAFHKAQFRRMCEKFADATDRVVISFVDWYPKFRKGKFRLLSQGEMIELAGFLGETAKEYGLQAMACCEGMDLTPYGIVSSACIDPKMVAEVCGCPVLAKPDKNQRPGCGCCESVDIGAYNTCGNGCVYCYANDSPETTRRRLASHRPESPILIGDIREGETILERNYRSHRLEQLTLY